VSSGHLARQREWAKGLTGLPLVVGYGVGTLLGSAVGSDVGLIVGFQVGLLGLGFRVGVVGIIVGSTLGWGACPQQRTL
jgi:hypothetical protein